MAMSQDEATLDLHRETAIKFLDPARAAFRAGGSIIATGDEAGSDYDAVLAQEIVHPKPGAP
jgi:hypothetical protein